MRWLLERKFSVELLRHFNQLRIAIEPEAAALATQYYDAEDLVAIRAGLAAWSGGLGKDESLDADNALHPAILAR